MAQSSYALPASDARTPEEWAREIFRDSLAQLPTGLFGKKGAGKPIIVDTRLKGKKGDKITYPFVPFADVDPIRGQDASVEGSENKFDHFIASLTIDEVNFPFLTEGDMTNQRSILDARMELRRQIADHFAQWNMTTIFKVLAGIADTENATTYESATNTTDRVNGARRCIRASGSNGYAVVSEASSDNAALVAALATTDTISPSLIMATATMARTKTSSNPYRLNPLRITNMKKMFKLYISPETCLDLIVHPDWLVRAVMAVDQGLESDPVATGSIGIIKNVIVEEAEQIPNFVDGSSNNYARNLLVGQDAGVLGWARTLTYVEQEKDYKRKLGANGSELRGQIKLAFDNKDDTTADIDCGVIQVVTAAKKVA